MKKLWPSVLRDTLCQPPPSLVPPESIYLKSPISIMYKLDSPLYLLDHPPHKIILQVFYEENGPSTLERHFAD